LPYSHASVRIAQSAELGTSFGVPEFTIAAAPNPAIDNQAAIDKQASWFIASYLEV
jgi:hypothetical protein